jgi:hypothetical protein
MQYCPKCRISVHGSKTCCPLCQGKLTGEPETPAFPTLRRPRVSSFSIIRVSAFIFIVFEIILAAVYYLVRHELGHPIPWIPIVMMGSAIAWADLILAIYLRNNIIRIITFEAYIAIILDYLIDLHHGFYGWSVNWMIPATYLALAAVTICIGKCARLILDDYLIYLITDSITCMLQLIPIILGQNTFEWPAVICMACYMILAVAALIFRPHDVKNASAKYFNI